MDLQLGVNNGFARNVVDECFECCHIAFCFAVEFIVCVAQVACKKSEGVFAG
jgi:hypothetical protein